MAGMPEDIWIGRVPGWSRWRSPPALAGFACRNNRLAELALRTDGFADGGRWRRGSAYGAERIAVVLGTSTAGIAETEQAYRRRDPASGALPADFDYDRTQDLHALPRYRPRPARPARPGARRSPPPAPPAPGRFMEAAALIARRAWWMRRWRAASTRCAG